MKTTIKASFLRFCDPLSLEFPSCSDRNSFISNSRSIRVGFQALMAISMFQISFLCHALDVDPGDYDPAPADTTLGLLYLQHAEREKLYLNGDKVSDKHKFDTDIAILRAVHYKEIGGRIMNFQLLLPFGHISTGGESDALGSESGMGDPILANAIWTKGSSSSQAFAITQYLYLPLGEYDNKSPINIGENRWKYVFQGGYTRGLSENISVDLVADVTFFGENDEYTAADLKLEQDHQYQMQAFMRYKLTDKFTIHAGYSRLWGGETEINGVSQSDESNQEKFLAGGSYFITPRTQILTSLGQDVSVDNGYKEDSRINLRFLHVF